MSKTLLVSVIRNLEIEIKHLEEAAKWEFESFEDTQEFYSIPEYIEDLKNKKSLFEKMLVEVA